MATASRLIHVDRRWSRLIAASLFIANFISLSSPAVSQVPRDGFWVVQGRGIAGMRCADWMMRLAVEQGRLTGSVGLVQGNVIIDNLVLGPDGRFSGQTRAGLVNGRSVRANQVRGQFVGDTVRVTLSNEICPDRNGSARRQSFGH
jgi:hypothetical protein